MIENLLRIRMAITQFYEEFKEGMDWYVNEMNRLKKLLVEKNEEITKLKQKLNEKAN